MLYLTYTICEQFNTIEELLERYEEIQYDVCDIEAWEDDTRITPWDK